MKRLIAALEGTRETLRFATPCRKKILQSLAPINPSIRPVGPTSRPFPACAHFPAAHFSRSLSLARAFWPPRFCAYTAHRSVIYLVFVECRRNLKKRALLNKLFLVNNSIPQSSFPLSATYYRCEGFTDTWLESTLQWRHADSIRRLCSLFNTRRMCWIYRFHQWSENIITKSAIDLRTAHYFFGPNPPKRIVCVRIRVSCWKRCC